MFGKIPGGKIIFIGGLPGSGKTTLGKGLVERLGSGATLIDGDAVFHTMTGKVAGLGEDISNRQDMKCLRQMMSEAVKAARQGRIAIVTDPFSLENYRRLCERLPNLLGLKFQGLWLIAPLEIEKDRTAQRKGLWLSGAPEPENFSAHEAWPLNPYVFAHSVSKKWIRIDASKSQQEMLAEAWPHVQPHVNLGLARPQAGQQTLAVRR